MTSTLVIMKFLPCCTKKMDSKTACKLFIIYGTQTGQSKSIAEDVKVKAADQGYDAEMMSMDESIDKMPWSDCNFVIFVTSSTGDGDPPENALHFWRKIRSKDLDSSYLSDLRYALLGLGDTNYTTYLGFPKDLQRQLQKLGAKQFYKSGWADDAVGLEVVVDPWIENLWPALTKQIESPHVILENEPPSSIPEEKQTAVESTAAKVISTEPVPSDQPIPAEIKDAEVEQCLASLASLAISVAPLNECNLKVPVLPQAYLELKFDPSLTFQPGEDAVQKTPMPSSKSPVYPAKVKSIEQLTSDKAVKTTLEVTLDLSQAEFEYEPGDAIGVICSNEPEEVDTLLARLNLLDNADVPFVLSVKKELAELKSGTKLKYEVPAHLPGTATLRYVLANCCEIRSVPRKALLRVMAEFTSSEKEKRRLLELCSAQGSDDYTELIRQPNINVLDLLNTFPSCQPPVERLLEQWPRLLARPYSISTSPLVDPKSTAFLFNIVEFPAVDGRTYERKGVATGRFQQLFKEFKSSSNSGEVSLSIYMRTNNGFRLPEDVETPMILIGPGTGLAPFLGFLAHREEFMKAHPTLQFGPIWLLYGCRNKDQDYLYKDELGRWHSAGIITRLLVSFSRDGDSSEPKYVQDLIRQHKTAFVRLVGKGARIYVCGDATNMAKDVMEAVTSAIQTVRNIEEQEAKNAVLQMQKEKRYLQDIWT